MSSTVRIDNATIGGGLTFAHTVGTGTHRYLIVQVNLGPNTVTGQSVTYAGQPLALLGRDNDTHTVEFWGLQDPLSGTNNVVITLTGSAGSAPAAISFEADSAITAPVVTTAHGSSAAPVCGITGKAGDLIVGGVVASGDATLTLGETELWNDEAGDAGAAIDGTGAGQSLTWQLVASGKWGVVAVALRAGAGTTVFGTLSSDLTNALAAAVTGATWYEGEPPDVLPPPTSAVGYVWVSDSQRVDSDHLLQQVQAYVRYYPVQADKADPETPIDPSPLYQAVDDIQNTLKAVQRTSDTSWFFEVTAAAVDHANQVVTATIIATGPNTFALS